MFRYSLILFFTFVTISIAAQEGSGYIFTQFKRKEGLTSDRVYRVTQDPDGFIWIGSDNGLQRYDGYRFMNVRHNPADKDGIPEDHVGQLHIDKKGRMWMSSGKQMGFFDRSKLTFTNVPVRLPDEELNRGTRKMLEDNEGRIIVFIGRQFLQYFLHR